MREDSVATVVAFPEKSLDQGLETYETDLTNKVTNQEFLETLFGNIEQNEQPVVVSFVENPGPADPRLWKGMGRQKAAKSDYLYNGANNYFSLSTFKPHENGSYNRQKKNFSALHAIMLDDVGTKVPLGNIKLEPSALIETSSRNFQAIYFFSEPIADLKQAEWLMKSIIAAGLCDPGADGPAARLARLPCALNTKREPSFSCALHLWKPENRYTLEDLIKGLGLEYYSDIKPNSQSRKKTPRPDAGDPVYVAVDSENPVLAGLMKLGLYKTPLGNGKHDITCPWVSEHTDGVDKGTTYFEPDDNYTIGGFNCFHAHCKNRNIKALLDFMEIEPKAARMKSTIYATPGELAKIIDAAERELAKSGRYFQRGGFIVVVETDPGTKETAIYEIKQSGIRVALSTAANWEKYSDKIEGYVRVDPPVQYPNALHDMPSYQYLPVLNGLARQPYLRPDGTLMTKPGYDAETGMFGVFSAQDFFIPENPSKEQAQLALKLLESVLEEFTFKNEADKSAALAAILTSAIRPSLSAAPMFHVKAPQIGSGKSYLCRSITAFCTLQFGAPTTFPQDDEECRKLLLAELLRSPAVIEFDNLTGDLIPHKSLCIALTSEHISGRILGISKTATVGTRTLFLSSGNNVGPIGDMARRCITITLDPACETPAAKVFKNPHLLRQLLRERGKYVSAALTIIRAWIVAGRPRQECRSLASFNEWVELCCQPLLWLGHADPMTSLFEAMNNDPEREMIARLIHAWRECFGRAPVMVRDLVEYSYKNHELREILEDIAPDKKEAINRRSLGRWIKRHAQRVVDGQRLVRADGSRSAEAWRLESVP